MRLGSIRSKQDLCRQFSQEFTSLLNSHFAVTDSLAIMCFSAKAAKNRELCQLVEKLIEFMRRGYHLSRALNEFPSVFDSVFLRMVAAGELSGKLPEVFAVLSHRQNQLYRTKEAIRNTVVYPLAILLLSGLVILALLVFVVPRFEQIFLNSPDIELPSVTRAILWLSAHINVALEIMAVMAGVVFLLGLLANRMRLWQEMVKFLVECAPVFGYFIRIHSLADFYRTLSILQVTRSYKDSLGIAIRIVRIRKVRRAQSAILHRVSQGVLIGKALAELCPDSFPKRDLAMIDMAEQTGKLTQTFAYLADQYESAFEQASNKAVRMVEPLSMLLLGGFIGLFVLALYMPLFQLGQTF